MGYVTKGSGSAVLCCMVSVAPFVVPKMTVAHVSNVVFTLFFRFYRRKCLIISSENAVY